MSCRNSGCNGNTRRGQYYCYDCYTCWATGGDEAVQARLATLRQATDSSQAQLEMFRLMEKKNEAIAHAQKQVAELQKFKDGVLGSIAGGRVPPTKLVPDTEAWAIQSIKKHSELARPILHARFKERQGLVDSLGNSRVPGHWREEVRRLKAFRPIEVQVGEALGLAADWHRSVPPDERVAHVVKKAAELAQTHEAVCRSQGHMVLKLDEYKRPPTAKHPSANQSGPVVGKQLDRIESLAKLSATYSPFWPHTYGVLLGAALASTYFLW